MIFGVFSIIYGKTLSSGFVSLLAQKPYNAVSKKSEEKNNRDKETSEKDSRASIMDKETEVSNNIFAAPQRDATVQLKISGFSQFDLGMTSQKQTDNDQAGTSNTPYFYIGNTNLKMEASVKKDKMVSGWFLRFNPQVNHGCSSVVDRNGIFWKHDDIGQFDAGNIKGVDECLFKFAQELIGGSNGWDGNLESLFFHPDDSHPCDGTDFVGSTHTATKISYVTPKISDILTIAATYTPSTAHRGNIKMNALNHMSDRGAGSSNNPNGFSYLTSKDGQTYKPFGTNNITFVARLDKNFAHWTFGGAFAYIHDSSEVWAQNKNKVNVKYALRDTNSFGFSGLVGYGKFNFGIEYMNNGKSRLPIDDTLYKTMNYAEVDSQKDEPSPIYKIEKGDKGHAGHVITATAQYKWTEKLTSAYGYQWTYRKLNDESNTARQTFTSTVNYLFMPGLEGYIETDLVFLKRMDNHVENKAASNNGFVVVAGVRINI